MAVNSHKVSCPRCGSEIQNGSRFCANCGLTLVPMPCPNCGAPVRPGGMFCAQCGTAIAGSSTLAVLAPSVPVDPLPMQTGGRWLPGVAVGLLALLAFRPLLKLGILLALGLLLVLGGASGNVGLGGGLLLVLVAFAFIFWPRRRS